MSVTSTVTRRITAGLVKYSVLASKYILAYVTTNEGDAVIVSEDGNYAIVVEV